MVGISLSETSVEATRYTLNRPKFVDVFRTKLQPAQCLRGPEPPHPFTSSLFHESRLCYSCPWRFR